MIKSKYKIVKYARISDMEREIESLLKDGWQLQGGVSMTIWGGAEVCFAQAMVKVG